MMSRSFRLFRHARIPVLVGLAAAFASVAIPATALATTFSGMVPAHHSNVSASPALVAVTVADTVPLLGIPLFTIDGVARIATVTYAILTPGYWYSDDWENDYWAPPVYDYKHATVTCAPGSLTDGLHLASVTMAPQEPLPWPTRGPSR